MKTREQILEAIKGGKESQALDGRDFLRLTNYFPSSDWEVFGIGLKEGKEPPPVREFTEENILENLESDLEFAFEKALDKRGLSASAMNGVITMWLWVLDDPLQDFEEYAEYGLPLLKAVAVKYGFENPIGEDAGNEETYAAYSDF